MLTYVVAYARFSSDNQREESIDAQLRAIRNYCDQRGYVLLKSYTDEAKSAMTDDRPAFQQMIHDSASGEFSLIVVHKLDRFARNRTDSAIYRKVLKDNGVRIESVLEHLDGSPESVIMEALLEGMSEYYSLNLSREVKKGKQETALQCKHNGGQPPYGFNVNPDGTYAVNEHEAKAVKLIFQMTTEGATMREIADRLNNAGYATRKGNKFSPTTINAMLHNEKYIGTYVYNRTVPQPKGGKRSNASRPDDEILRVPNGMPAIVGKQTFLEVQEILKRRASQASKRSGAAHEIYLLQGLIKCGNCGSAMTGMRRKDGRNKTMHHYYECQGRKKKRTDCDLRSVNRDLVEGFVIDYIENKILSDEAIDIVKQRITQNAEEIKNKSSGSVASLSAELSQVEIALDKLIDAIVAGVDPMRVKDKINSLEERRAIIKQLIEEEERRQKAVDRMFISGLDDYLKEFRDIKSRSRKHQKEIINKFVSEVVIYDDGTDSGNRLVLKLIIPDLAVDVDLDDYRTSHLDSINGSRNYFVFVYEISLSPYRRASKRPRKHIKS